MDERGYQRAFPLALAGLFVFLAIGIGAGGWKYYLRRSQSIKTEIQSDLATIASLKIDQITEWRRERLDDASSIAWEAESHLSALRDLLSHPDREVRSRLLAWLKEVQDRYRFAELAIVDESGSVALSTEREDVVSPEETQVVRQAAASDKPVFSDFLSVKNRVDRIRLDLAIALLPREELRNRSGAVLVMRIDPQTRLYPLVQSWPTQTRSAETLLIRREGEEVVYLNELRFRRDTALRLRLPLSEAQLPASAAARGQEGPFEGRDYRGIPVLAMIRPVPGTPWSMVAKIDREEIYAPLREETQTILAFVLLLIGSTGIALAYLWKVQTSRFFLQRYREENEMRLALLASERERDQVIAQLHEAIARVKALSGILPICASCKKIRDDQGYWQQVEGYISQHSEAEFSHGICPECAARLYPGFFKGRTAREDPGASPPGHGA